MKALGCVTNCDAGTATLTAQLLHTSFGVFLWNFTVFLFLSFVVFMGFYVVRFRKRFSQDRKFLWYMGSTLLFSGVTVIAMFYDAFLVDGWDWVVSGWKVGLATAFLFILGAVVATRNKKSDPMDHLPDI